MALAYGFAAGRVAAEDRERVGKPRLAFGSSCLNHSPELLKLRQSVERLFESKPTWYSEQDKKLFQHFRDLLNRGVIRSAEPDASRPAGWRVNGWVKKGILLGFSMGEIIEMPVSGSASQFFDKST